MERQTLQQEVPVYHVCQQCNGAGCQACSDLLILDGDIQLDPELVDELPAVAPINGVIGTTAGADSAPKADPVCPKCGKSRFDSAYGCLAPQVYSPAAGDWVCGKKTTAPSPKPAPKYDISFDDRNMYQRREDDLRLAGEWEV